MEKNGGVSSDFQLSNSSVPWSSLFLSERLIFLVFLTTFFLKSLTADYPWGNSSRVRSNTVQKQVWVSPSTFLKSAQAGCALHFKETKQRKDLDGSGLFQLKVLGKHLSSERRNAKFRVKHKSTPTTTAKVVFLRLTSVLQADNVLNSIACITPYYRKHRLSFL